MRQATLAKLRRRKFNRARATFRKKEPLAPTARVAKTKIMRAFSNKATSARSLAIASRVVVAQQDLYAATLPRTSARVFRGKRQSASLNIVQRLLGLQAVNNARNRRAGLWQSRSVRSMRRLERTLSAWAPQYQTRARRWASPRQDGILLRRSWLSRRQVRERASLNAALTKRHRPRHLHWDRAFIHLQYYLGSAATVGYDRLRRVHRLHSRFSR